MTKSTPLEKIAPKSDAIVKQSEAKLKKLRVWLEVFTSFDKGSEEVWNRELNR